MLWQDSTSRGSCYCCVLTGREKKRKKKKGQRGHSPCAQSGRWAGASRPGDAAQTMEHPLLERFAPRLLGDVVTVGYMEAASTVCNMSPVYGMLLINLRKCDRG